MYNGEVKIFQENLDRFLAIAQRFQLQGLMMKEVDSTEEIYHHEKKDLASSAQPVLPSASNDFVKEDRFLKEESEGSLPEK